MPQNPDCNFFYTIKNGWAHNAVFFKKYILYMKAFLPWITPPSILEYAGNTHKCSKCNAIWRNDELISNLYPSPLSFCNSDIEEYAKITCNCSNDNATCESSEGSFKCVCKPGFSGDGQNCRGNENYPGPLCFSISKAIQTKTRRSCLNGNKPVQINS